MIDDLQFDEPQNYSTDVVVNMALMELIERDVECLVKAHNRGRLYWRQVLIRDLHAVREVLGEDFYRFRRRDVRTRLMRHQREADYLARTAA